MVAEVLHCPCRSPNTTPHSASYFSYPDIIRLHAPKLNNILAADVIEIRDAIKAARANKPTRKQAQPT
jgi:hypothetical protein